MRTFLPPRRGRPAGPAAALLRTRPRCSFGPIAPTSPLVLGLDIGTSRTKAVLVDVEGAEVAGAVVDTPFAATQAGVEAEVDDLRGSAARVLAGLGDVRGVEAVGIAGLAESGAPLDGDGRPLAPVIAWHDIRGGEAVELLTQRFGDELSRRIGQRLRTVSSVAKLGWLVANGVEGVRWWVGVPELFLHDLTGARATDFSLAARTGAYDVARRCFVPEVLEAVGAAPDVFAEPSPAGTVMGKVTSAGAGWSGLREGIPVTIAGHDHLVGMVGAGAGEGAIANSVGTAETVVGSSRQLPDIERALVRRASVTLRPGGDGWAVLCSGARAGLVLSRVAEALGRSPAELDGLADRAGAVDARELVAALERDSQPKSVAGEPGEIWNGVLVVMAERMWDAATRVQEVCGPAQSLVVFGGGSRSAPWLRAKASRSALPVARSTAREAVARGAALYAGVAAGWWSSAGEAPRPPLETVEATAEPAGGTRAS